MLHIVVFVPTPAFSCVLQEVIQSHSSSQSQNVSEILSIDVGMKLDAAILLIHEKTERKTALFTTMNSAAPRRLVFGDDNLSQGISDSLQSIKGGLNFFIASEHQYDNTPTLL